MKEIFESTLEKLLADQVTLDLVKASEEQGWMEPLWDLLQSSGFSLAAAPEESGGTGLGWEELNGVIELCGRFCLPLPLPESILSNWLLGACGLQGLNCAVSFAAENSLQWDGKLLSGSVRQVPWGRYVDKLVTVVGSESPVVVVLEPNSAASSSLSTNLAGESRDDFIFENYLPIDSSALPSNLDSQVLLKGGAMLRSAQIIGALEELLRVSAEYGNERVQFGKPITKFQVVQHQLAVVAENVAAARVSVQAAFEESGSAFPTLQLMAAKICTSDAASVGASTAHAVHGAIGFTQEYSLHPLTRRLWSWRSEYGSATYWSKLLGKSICEMGSEALWPTITSGDLNV
ncbi:acyl-CoA/acyl-ACP dehydrogenase [Aestuariicella hydrocarbonica]|uniref:Acyl-CoA/acyl-ACP dehydrogenase n=1 Tax=Pseudomaricurvus hydrocarbonicus TaxID=1470433 RepID=A0A9E5JY13_9GAMM|nr:acyl-CoA dehydrogenase family protein [Aestuariicella hydrocarbonica]NHO66716.1 acyl-CoA/acyl-ACP dehydrogenase [Aestuariicella hydrocarbonica]